MNVQRLSDLINIRKNIIELCLLSKSCDNFRIVKKIKEIVPEYISNNSKWAKDPISIAYVFKRCGAVYLYASALTSNKDQIKAFDRASNSSLQFAHQVLVKKKKMSSTKATDIVFGALDKILLNYKNDLVLLLNLFDWDFLLNYFAQSYKNEQAKTN